MKEWEIKISWIDNGKLGYRTVRIVTDNIDASLVELKKSIKADGFVFNSFVYRVFDETNKSIL